MERGLGRLARVGLMVLVTVYASGSAEIGFFSDTSLVERFRSCPSYDDGGERDYWWPGLEYLLDEADGWHHLDAEHSVTLVDGDDPRFEDVHSGWMVVELDQAVTVVGDHEDWAMLGDLEARTIGRYLPADADVYVAEDRPPGSPARVRWVVAVGEDGVAFMHDCGRLTQELAGFAETRDATAADTFVGLLTGEITTGELVAWQAARELPDPRDLAVWESLAPEDRFLSADDAPPEVVERLVTVPLFIDVDRDPVEPETHLCTRSVEAQGGECHVLFPAMFLVGALPDVPLVLTTTDAQTGRTVDVAELSVEMIEEVGRGAERPDPMVLRVRGLDTPGRDGRGVTLEPFPRERAEELLDERTSSPTSQNPYDAS